MHARLTCNNNTLYITFCECYIIKNVVWPLVLYKQMTFLHSHEATFFGVCVGGVGGGGGWEQYNI